jgi:hypothetical protein
MRREAPARLECFGLWLAGSTTEQRAKVAERYWAKLQPWLQQPRWQWVPITKHNAMAADAAGNSVRVQPPCARHRALCRARPTSEEVDAHQPVLTARLQPLNTDTNAPDPFPLHDDCGISVVSWNLRNGSREERNLCPLKLSSKPSDSAKLLSFSSNTAGLRKSAASVDNLWINLLSPARRRRKGAGRVPAAAQSSHGSRRGNGRYPSASRPQQESPAARRHATILSSSPPKLLRPGDCSP